jgi:hypothetical protein
VVRSGGVNIGAFQASAASFVVSAPATASAGTASDVSVAVYDMFGQLAVGYAGTVHFSSTDSQAGLPADYAFQTADQGVHLFPGGATLVLAGTQTLTATDTVTAGITGSATLTVTPGTAVQILLSGPTNVQLGVAFTLTVTAYDAYGNVATGYLGTIHFDSTDPAGQLPADYAFQPTDGGSATFTLTLNTAGPIHLTCTDGGGLSNFLDLTAS